MHRRSRRAATLLLTTTLTALFPASTPAAQTIGDSLKCPANIADIPVTKSSGLVRHEGGKLLQFQCTSIRQHPPPGIDISFRVDWAIESGTTFTCKFIAESRETLGIGGYPPTASATKAATSQYFFHASGTNEQKDQARAKYVPFLKKLADEYLPKVEPEAVDCETTEGACAVQGVVTGRRIGRRIGGRAIEGVKVELTYGKRKQTIATNAEGRYKFKPIGGGPSPGFDPEKDQVNVRVQLSEWARKRFDVLDNDTPAVLSSDFFKLGKEERCERNFDASSIPSEYTSSNPGKDRWPDVVEIYYHLQRAWRLAELLRADVRYGLPLKIRAFCTSEEYGCRGERGAFARVSQTNGAPIPAPFIGIPPARSVLSSGSWPDNREYHEFAHYFQAAVFGAVPAVDGSTNHGGYYVNPDSADSWAEAFAEFFSMMVSKHVDLRPYPEMYRVDGEYRNFENDYRPWTHGGKAEELALAGLLLDVEDGPEDYATKREPPQFTIICCERSESHAGIAFGVVTLQTIAQGKLRPLNYSEATRLWVTLPDGSGRFVPTVPADIEPGESAFFGVPLPAGADPKAIKAVASEARPGDVATDDDPLNLTLQEVWAAIRGYKSTDKRGNGGLFDVADLYRAFKAAFGGRDADKDGTDDVDQVFVTHGFFADLDGDHSWEKGEPVGLTSHPAGEKHAAKIPRFELPSFEEEKVSIDTGNTAATIAVQVAYAKPFEGRSYGTVARPDAEGRIRVAMPPAQPPATVSLIAFADGYAPALLGEITGEGFASEAEKNPGRSFLTFTATMKPVAARAASRRNGLPVGVVAGAGAALLLGIAAVFARNRRRGPAAAPTPPSPAVCASCGAPRTGTAFCIQCGARTGE